MDIGYFEFNNHKINIKKTKNGFSYMKENKKPFTEEEKNLLKNVNNMLTINKRKSKFIKKIKLTKIYNLYYDFKSKNYFWIPEDNIYNEIDNKILNIKYNHQEEILYDKLNPNLNDIRFYKKIVNFANKSIVIFLATSIALSMSFPNAKIDEKLPEVENTYIVQEQPSETKYEITTAETEPIIDETKDDVIYIYDFKDIEEAIDKNENLTEEEKNIIKRTRFVFDENHMYMDMNLVLERLKTLKVIYDYNFDNPYTQGSYSITDNVIKLRSKTIKGYLQEFIHEYLHSLQISHNSFLMELSNQFFTNEVIMRLYEEQLLEDCYFYDKIENGKIINSEEIKEYTESEKMNLLLRNNTFERGYMGYAGIYYILAELIPEHSLRAFQFNPADIEIIIEGLEEADPNKDFLRIFNLIIEISDIRFYNIETLQWEYKSDVTEVYNLLNELCKDINGKHITENPDLLLSYMMDDSYFIDKEDDVEDEYKIAKEFIRNYLGERYILRLPKTYLSNIRENSLLVYKNQEDGSLYHIEIDEIFQNEYIDYLIQNNNENQNLILEKRVEG